MLIGGEWVESDSGDTIEIVDPSSEQIIGTVPAASEADVEQAVWEAKWALQSEQWQDLEPQDRSRLIWSLADAIERSGRELA